MSGRRNPLHGVLNQITYPGVVPPGDTNQSDADDCWVVATFLALVMAGWLALADLPTVKAFRAAAGNPDRPNHVDGGTNRQIATAIAKLLPEVRITAAIGWRVDDVLQAIRDGWVASLAVWSASLPKDLRFGFNEGHQVTISWDGKRYRFANPLAADGSAPLVIAEHDLRRAAEAWASPGHASAILIAPHGTWFRYGGRRLVNSTPFVAVGDARVFDRPTLQATVVGRLHRGDRLIPHQVTERGQRVGTKPRASWWIANANGDEWVRRRRLRRAA